MNFFKSHKWTELKNSARLILLNGGVSGVFVGAIVTLYVFAADKLGELARYIYGSAADKVWLVPLILIGLVALSAAMYFIFKLAPEVHGSGIPQTEGVMRGLLTFRWLRVLLCTVGASFISFFSGLSLGSEGPSVQLGATIANGSSRLLRSNPATERYTITAGAGAGLGVAFRAPLTGIVFAVEEAHKRVTPTILLTSAAAVLTASLISNLLINHLLHINVFLFQVSLKVIPFADIGYMLLLALALGLVSSLFHFLLVSSKKRTDRLRAPEFIKLAFTFLVTGGVALISIGGFDGKDLTGGGAGLINKLLNMDFALQIVAVLLVLKIVMTMLCFDSGATGGLFIPILSIGALIGGLMAKLFIYMGMDPALYQTVILISMTAFLAGVVRTPITAVVLIFEITGAAFVNSSGFQYPVLLMAAIVIFLTFFIAEMLISRPFYDKLLSNYLKDKYKGQKKQILVFEIEIMPDAFVIGKTVRDVLWPANCIVLKITHGGVVNMDNDGEKSMRAGDKYHVQVETYDPEATTRYLSELVGSQPTLQTSGNGGSQIQDNGLRKD